ncbi:PAS domain-containing protein [Tsuneonella amylolytica]|uniref:PAS domain-containing protein n=1 Tax=Tsuneonella amylolytica TaxID=2338327 RepID=UPI000EA83C88
MDNLRAQFGLVDYDEDDFGVGEEEAVREPPPSPIGQDERRMQVRAYNHWAGLLGDGNFPSIEDLDPASLGDFGPYSVLLDFTNGIDDPAIRFLGTELGRECDIDPSIGRLGDVPSRSLLSRITDHYMQILANQAPIGFEAEFVNQRGATILYRGILLPYSSDDDTIDFIYGVINWKEVADQLTSDELLLEIDSALEDDTDMIEATMDDRPRSPAPVTDWADGPGTVSAPLGAAGVPVSPLATKPAEDRFPQPAFGGGIHDDGEDDGEDDGDEAGLYEAIEAVDDEPESANRFGSLLSLGGGTPARADFDEDDDDFGDDDEDPVAKWLGRHTPLRSADDIADDDGATLESQPYELGEDASYAGIDDDFADEPFELTEAVEDEAAADEPAFAVPEAYEPETSEPVALETGASLPLEADYSAAAQTQNLASAGMAEPAPQPALAATGDESGMHDCLAAARELALAAKSSEDRSRSALYAAVGRAYDFSLAAQAEPQEFAELVEDSGLTMQDRAPMTPVVKLVFGADYDKTRIAEYASVLSFAHREGIERGALADFLSRAEGGLKGVVQAERAARKSADAAVRETPREALARKLRAIAPMGFEDIPAEGEEFAVVVIRRVAGEVVVLGEVADVPLVERVARKLVA